MKFSRTPRLHARLLFRQFWQSGMPSSHFRCRSLQVKQPVRTRLDLAEPVAAAGPRSVASLSGALSWPVAGPVAGAAVDVVAWLFLLPWPAGRALAAEGSLCLFGTGISKGSLLAANASTLTAGKAAEDSSEKCRKCCGGSNGVGWAWCWISGTAPGPKPGKTTLAEASKAARATDGPSRETAVFV